MATILIIDDDEAVRRAIRKTFETRGHVIVEAADGDSGVEAFQTHHPDLVITDLYMPGGDGMEGLIRMVSEQPNAQVIVMTGGGWDQVKPLLEKARSLGAVATLEKPFGVPELLATVNEVLEPEPSGD